MTSKCRMTGFSGLLATLALVTTAGISLAQDLRARPASDWVITRAQLNKTECTCRLRGENLPVGSEVCMQNSMFRCQMNQNVTTWQPLASPCPLS